MLASKFCSPLPAFGLLHIKAYGLCECVDIYVVNHLCVSIVPKRKENIRFGEVNACACGCFV